MENVSQTKRQLANSLKELMCHTSFNKITVQNVTGNCGLNRQTFYYHFKDMYELLSWIYNNDIFNQIADKQNEPWETAVKQVVRYAKANRVFCRNTIRSIKKENLENFLYPIFKNWVQRMGKIIINNEYIGPKDKHFFIEFFTNAFVNYGIRWVSHGMIENEGYIIDRIKALIKLLQNNTDNQNKIAI